MELAHPFTGLDIRFGTSKIERWYYPAHKACDPVSMLRNQVRQYIGRFPSFSPEAAHALRVLYAEHPVRAPAHDGQDSGVMADTFPEA